VKTLKGRFCLNLPNLLTLTRLFIGPFFLFLYLEYESLGIDLIMLPYILLSLLCIAELSDACDGYFARKYDEVTDLGKILDPMADSIYRLSIFLTFTLPPVQLPMILLFIFLYRDMIISTLRTVCALKGFALDARPSGKLKAAIQGCAVFIVTLLLVPYTQGDLAEDSLQVTSAVIVAIAACYTFFSGAEYLYAHQHHLKHFFAKKEPKPSDYASL
jgi:CDP-diacylglycerol--glycerol-3-phosphate 3-phosphatidyltransferase